jgi:hypothetical protein
MAGAIQSGVLSEREYEALAKALSSNAKGRAFLAEHIVRARPEETRNLLLAVGQIEASLSVLREQLLPARMADELRRIAADLQRSGEDAALRARTVEDLRKLAGDLGAMAESDQAT